MSPSPLPQPSTARITSLAHWATFFHPESGLFRSHNDGGDGIVHLDIDLRFVEHEHEPPSTKEVRKLATRHPIHLPHVAWLTLRGGEYVQDSEDRMDALAEVLFSIKPIEVQWLNAAADPSEQLTFSTHLVHPAIIAAGEQWAQDGCLRKLVIQGGFPCPNLTAPTPYAVTPGHTPCPSPSPYKTSFGAGISPMTSRHFSSIPALSSTKPKNDEKLRERAERKRQAEFSYKPRFDFAFGGWGVEQIRWRVDGRYTPACILAVITNLFKALNTTFPSPSRNYDLSMPSLITFTPFPPIIASRTLALQNEMELEPDFVHYLEDALFVSDRVGSKTSARIFPAEPDDRARRARRFKADMLLLSSYESEIVPYPQLFASPGSPPLTAKKEEPVGRAPASPESDVATMSPSSSFCSPVPGQTDATTDDELEAMTPDLLGSIILEPGDTDSTHAGKTEPAPSTSGSLVM